MNVVHSWLKEYVGDDLPEAKETAELLGYHAFEIDGVEEVEGESVIDIDVLPNRASDCLCHRGVARELATILDVKLANDPLQNTPTLEVSDKIQINIADQAACSRFTISHITGVEVKDSPEWLQKRLRVLGQRPINNIVDATNYVMLAIGQPLHAYDADKFPKLNDGWQFDIRFAKEGEEVSLLAEGGGTEDRVVELKGTELLIVDGATDTPVGLAGIKGGRFAELDKDTKNVLVEAAHFDPAVIRKTARRLGILTDASKRFENEPARDLASYAQAEIISLIEDIAVGKCAGVVDEYLLKQELSPVIVKIEKLNKRLGLDLSEAEISKIIERTGSKVVNTESGSLEVLPPWERTDLNIEEDYIEEVGRIHGLNNIESVAPVQTTVAKVNLLQYYGDKIRQALIQAGFSEVITSSFQKKDKIQLQNALASDKSYVRSNLTKNINKVLDANFTSTDLLGLNDLRVFEIGTVFSKTETSITEHVSLTLGARTKGNGYNPKDDALLQAGCDAVTEALGQAVDWKIEKGVAETNLTAILEKLETPSKYDDLPAQPDITYQAFSVYPAIARDIALWVGEDKAEEEVLEILTNTAGDLCVRQSLFDTFSKDGRTSYAFRLVFQATDRTLTDTEINDIMEKINQVAEENNWEVR